jgi:hypothetical protein
VEEAMTDLPPMPREQMPDDWDEKAAMLVGPYFESISGNGVACRKAVARALQAEHKLGAAYALEMAAKIAEADDCDCRGCDGQCNKRVGPSVADQIRALASSDARREKEKA